MTTQTRLTLDEFLCLPETEPASEFIDGDIVQKMSPNWYHSVLVQTLIRRIGRYLDEHPSEGRLATELRHAARAEDRAYVPDVSVMLRQNVPRDPAARRSGPIWAPPDFAIEVLSPGDYPGRVLDRADFYMRVGTSLLWLVDPELETITVFRPRQAPSVHRAPGNLDATPVLERFVLDLAGLFATLHEDEDEAPAG